METSSRFHATLSLMKWYSEFSKKNPAVWTVSSNFNKYFIQYSKRTKEKKLFFAKHVFFFLQFLQGTEVHSIESEKNQFSILYFVIFMSYPRQSSQRHPYQMLKKKEHSLIFRLRNVWFRWSKLNPRQICAKGQNWLSKLHQIRENRWIRVVRTIFNSWKKNRHRIPWRNYCMVIQTNRKQISSTIVKVEHFWGKLVVNL